MKAHPRNPRSAQLPRDLATPSANPPYVSATPLAPGERHFLSEVELASRWGLSPKTLQRWRGLGSGPVFAKFSKKVGYPIDGQDGVLDWEQRVLYRSTSERAFVVGGAA